MGPSEVRKWGLTESKQRGRSQSFPSEAPRPWAGLRLQDPSCQQAHTHLGTPHPRRASALGRPSHLPGGRTGPSCLLPLWVQSARPLLGLLFVLWGPESHMYKGSVGISRHSPSPTPTGPQSQARPLFPPCGSLPPTQVADALRGLDRDTEGAPPHLPHCTQGCRVGAEVWNEWDWAARKGHLWGSGSTCSPLSNQ